MTPKSTSLNIYFLTNCFDSNGCQIFRYRQPLNAKKQGHMERINDVEQCIRKSAGGLKLMDAVKST